MKNKINNDKHIFNLGLIGVGRWGRNIVKTISQNPSLKLICVASSNKDTKNLVNKDCEIFKDWKDLINYPGLNGVIIATPPKTHFEISENYIKAGYPVLIEKPLTLNYEDAKKIYNLSLSKNTLVMNDLTQLFNYKFLALKDSLKLVGDIKYLITKSGNHGPYRNDTPVIWDWGTHDLSILISLMGSSPEKIIFKRIKEKKNIEGEESLWNINCDFNNEISSTSVVGNMIPKCRQIGILGSKGMLVFDDLGLHSLKFYSNWTKKYLPKEGGHSIALKQGNKPLYSVLESFSCLVRKGMKKHWSLSMSVEISRLLSQCSL